MAAGAVGPLPLGTVCDRWSTGGTGGDLQRRQPDEPRVHPGGQVALQQSKQLVFLWDLGGPAEAPPPRGLIGPHYGVYGRLRHAAEPRSALLSAS